jgi:hypothetical protein
VKGYYLCHVVIGVLSIEVCRPLPVGDGDTTITMLTSVQRTRAYATEYMDPPAGWSDTDTCTWASCVGMTKVLASDIPPCQLRPYISATLGFSNKQDQAVAFSNRYPGA